MGHKRRELLGRLAVAALVVATALAAPGASGAAALPPGAITIYANDGITNSYGITVGPDGALWFTNYQYQRLGRLTTGGMFTLVSDARINYPWGITTGPDGALWFTNFVGSSIGRMTTSGAFTFYGGFGVNGPNGIVAGPDGALWFTNFTGSTIGRITTSGAVTNFWGPGVSNPREITVGPDGALWFTNYSSNTISRITTGGALTTYSDPSIRGPWGIALGPDGALWFTNNIGNTIGRITTDGTVTSYGGADIREPVGIVAGQDGALWFTNFRGNTIGRITTGGSITSYGNPAIASTSFAGAIAAGPDGGLWFSTLAIGAYAIGRIQATGDTTPPTIVVPPDVTADATSPAGVVVTYAVTTTDDTDPSPALTCAPKSGATFPIGNTTVTCTATDAAGNVATASFLVHVKGAAEQLADLAAALEGVGPGTGLAAKVTAAQLLLSLGKSGAAANVLGAFANEVSAQSGKKIGVAQAAALLADANRIQAVLGSS